MNPTQATMRLEPTGDGFTIAAEDLGPLIGVAPAEVPILMRAGTITSRFERGEGADAGRCRLTFIHANRRLALIVDEDGRVLQRHSVTIADRPPRSATPGAADRSRRIGGPA